MDALIQAQKVIRDQCFYFLIRCSFGRATGLVKAQWAPDGRTVLCFSDWGVSLGVPCTGTDKTTLAAARVTLVNNNRHCDLYSVSNPSR
jgi:hypothetical protein